MRIALGVLGGLAVAVSGAGWWAPVGIALAALFALAMPRTGDSAGAVAAGEGTSRDRLLDGLGRAARLGVVVFAASTFAEYLAPDSRLAVAVLFVVGVAMVDLIGVRFGLRLDAYWRRWIGGLCAAAGAAFVAVCLGVPPVADVGQVEPVALWGVPLAAAVFVPVFVDTTRRVVIAGGIAAVAVSAAALYQLGPVRLGLSTTALRDVFAAADAQALAPVLGMVVALACVPAALLAFGAASRDAHPSPVVRTVVPAAVASVGAALLSPVGAVTVAAGLVLAHVVARVVAVPPHGRRTPRAVAVAVAGVALLAGLVAGL